MHGTLDHERVTYEMQPALTGTSVDVFGSSTEEGAYLDESTEVSCIQDMHPPQIGRAHV